MSGGYASRLSEYKNKGLCGLPESFDTPRALTLKVNKLARLIRNSNKTVVLTGAGISTAAGIKDFRGPNGIWTQEVNDAKREYSGPAKRRRREQSTDDAGSHGTPEEIETESFACVSPTYSHRALQCLVRENVFQYIITQNVDGLHLRSGLPRSRLSILHGDCFVEKCEKCNREYFRDFDIGGLSFKKTGRTCNGEQILGDPTPGCGGALRDTILDWEDELPEKDYDTAEEMCKSADLVITLGTSLRIIPAGQLPLKAKQFVVVNLQQTPYDQNAAIVIHHYIDTVMRQLLDKLSFSCE